MNNLLSKYTRIIALLLFPIMIGCSSNVHKIKAYPRPSDYNLYLSSAPNEIRAEYAQSLSLFYQGRLKLASARLNSLIAQNPDFWGSYYYLGMIEKELGSYQRAIEIFNEAIKRAVKEPKLRSKIYLASGECWELIGNFADAKKHYRVAININPNSASATESYNRVSQLIAQK